MGALAGMRWNAAPPGLVDHSLHGLAEPVGNGFIENRPQCLFDLNARFHEQGDLAGDIRFHGFLDGCGSRVIKFAVCKGHERFVSKLAF